MTQAAREGAYEMTADEVLEVCGPPWSKMSGAERTAYGPRQLRGRADRTRALVRRLAEEWGIIGEAA